MQVYPCGDTFLSGEFLSAGRKDLIYGTLHASTPIQILTFCNNPLRLIMRHHPDNEEGWNCQQCQ